MSELDKARLGLLPALAERAPSGQIGRTALMKYMYFLQTLRGLPLGYNFTMYSYGPFDSAVLSDLNSAELLNIVEVTEVDFPGGYGYRIKPGPQASSAKKAAGNFLTVHNEDLNWLFSVFGSLNSAELELTSSIVFFDQEFADLKQMTSVSEVAKCLQELKPHFSREKVEGFVNSLLQKGALTATARSLTNAC